MATRRLHGHTWGHGPAKAGRKTLISLVKEVGHKGKVLMFGIPTMKLWEIKTSFPAHLILVLAQFFPFSMER